MPQTTNMGWIWVLEMQDRSYDEIWNAVLDAADKGDLVIVDPTVVPDVTPTPAPNNPTPDPQMPPAQAQTNQPTREPRGPIHDPNNRPARGNDNHVDRPKPDRPNDFGRDIAKPHDGVPDKPKPDRPKPDVIHGGDRTLP